MTGSFFARPSHPQAVHSLECLPDIPPLGSLTHVTKILITRRGNSVFCALISKKISLVIKYI